MNLAEGILKQRDRLLQIKDGTGELWDSPALAYYRLFWTDMFDRATKAISGHMDVVEMIKLYNELEKFE